MQIVGMGVLFFALSCGGTNTATYQAPAPAPAPVEALELDQLAEELLSHVRASGATAAELQAAADGGDVCAALALSRDRCAVLADRVADMVQRHQAAGGAAVEPAGPLGGACAPRYRGCSQAALGGARFLGHPGAMLGGVLLGLLRCHCKHCEVTRLQFVCRELEALP